MIKISAMIETLGLEGNELEAFQRYIGGESAADLAAQYGIKPMFLYEQKARLRKKIKKKREFVDEPVIISNVATKVMREEESKPAKHVNHQIPSISPSAASAGCPFFPSKGSNEIHRLNIRRILTEPPQLMNELGTGLLANVDPSFDDNAVRKSWGGGRYEIE